MGAEPTIPLDVTAYMRAVGRRAREAARIMAKADSATKNRALAAIAEAIALAAAAEIHAWLAGRGGRPHLWAALQDQFDQADDDGAVRADEARLQEVLRLRKENFETHGGADTRDARQLVPGRSWAAWSRALGMLLPRLKVADLGCGEGYLTIEAARWAERVVAVDRSETVLNRAKGLAKRRRVANVTWKRGELDKLPIKDETVDVALLSQALHHAQDPVRAVAPYVPVP